MKKELQIKEVEFNGDKLIAVRDDNIGKVYVGVRWICNGLGFNKNLRRAQEIKIHGDIVLSKGVKKITLPTSGGLQETICVELDYLPMWLAKINANIIKDTQTKEKLVQYQLKAKDVLANAFLQGIEQAHNKFIIPQTLPDALRLAANLAEKIEILEPKARQYDEFMASRGLFNLNYVAKVCNTGRTRLFRMLRNSDILNSDNSPKQEYVERGYFKVKVRTICGDTYLQPLATPRGLNFISEVI